MGEGGWERGGRKKGAGAVHTAQPSTAQRGAAQHGAAQRSAAPAQCPAPAPGSCTSGRRACRPGSRLHAVFTFVRGRRAGRDHGRRMGVLVQPRQSGSPCQSRPCLAPQTAPPTRERGAEDGDAVAPGPVVDGVGVVDLLPEPRNHLRSGGRQACKAGLGCRHLQRVHAGSRSAACGSAAGAAAATTGRLSPRRRTLEGVQCAPWACCSSSMASKMGITQSSNLQ